MDGMVKKIVLWLLVAANMAAIFIFSSQPAEKSTVTSGTFAYRVLEAVSPSFRALPEEEKMNRVGSMQNVFRKGAHFSIYTLLGFLICLLLTKGYSVKRGFTFAPFIAALYAASDEFHQTFVPGRSAQFGDVVIDFAGAVLGTLFAWVVLWLAAKVRSKYNGRDS